MATYQFRCETEGCSVGEVEEIQPMSAEHALVCPECAQPMRLLITGGTGVIFKGGGWTPRFAKLSAPPYDPEKDMESISRQQKEAGMPEEKEPWKPKKAVHPIRSTGISIPSKP